MSLRDRTAGVGMIGAAAGVLVLAVIATGLSHLEADTVGDGTGDHPRASAVWLSGVHAYGRAQHRHSDLLCLMAGKLGGAFRTGGHLGYPLDTPMANLLLTVLDAVGVPVDRWATALDGCRSNR